eukprot:Nitzschia sp. Nitz4//scaffold122_size67431//1665//3800//NITZ4_006081-RA/size67431-processed-gene-0.32-mRNA-1//1//CDS//3329534391//391//frame0
MGGSRRSMPPMKSGVAPPVAVKAKDYSQDRPMEVQNELDDLRNRGIAKVLNRHFTDTTKKLAKEKAAADAALADLERRRANTSEFVPSSGGELSSFDSMYVQLQRKRAECRRKERETILLYQRYVYKYGKKADISVPTPSFSIPREDTASPSPSATSTTSTLEAPPPPSPAPMRHLQPLEEHAEEDLSLGGKQLGFSELPEISEVQQSSDCKTPTKQFADENKTIPMTIAGVREHWEKQASANPILPESLSPEQVIGAHAVLDADRPDSAFLAIGEIETARQDSFRDIIEKMESSSQTSDPLRPAREVPAGVGEWSMWDDDDDDRSAISGLTMNSQLTRQVIEQIELEKDQFLKTETEAIRRMLDEEDEKTQSSGGMVNSSTGSTIGDQSRLASIKAEAMVREMQQILDNYAKEDASVSVNAEESSAASVATSKSQYPRKYPTANPNEEWKVYYDESRQREYYFEERTKRTQWEDPNGPVPSMADSKSMMEESPVVVRPRSRRELYRRRLRKRRIRKFLLLCFLLLLVGATLFHWRHNHPEKPFKDAMLSTWSTASGFALSMWRWLKEQRSSVHPAVGEEEASSVVDALNDTKSATEAERVVVSSEASCPIVPSWDEIALVPPRNAVDTSSDIAADADSATFEAEEAMIVDPAGSDPSTAFASQVLDSMAVPGDDIPEGTLQVATEKTPQLKLRSYSLEDNEVVSLLLGIY